MDEKAMEYSVNWFILTLKWAAEDRASGQTCELFREHRNKRLKVCNGNREVGWTCPVLEGTTGINCLPFDCFYMIFECFNLAQQLTTLQLVCRHWKWIIDTMCQQKGSLTINLYADSDPSHFVIKPNKSLLINSDHFSPLLSEYIARQFPRLNKLVLRSKYKNWLEWIHPDFNQNHRMTQRHPVKLAAERMLLSLLSQSWPCLTKLTVSILHDLMKAECVSLPRFYSTIQNSSYVSNLEQVDLYVKTWLDGRHALVHLSDVLPKPNRVSIVGASCETVPQMLQLEDNKITDFCFNCELITLSCLKDVLKARPQLFSRITHLRLIDAFLVDWPLALFPYCESVQFLDIAHVSSYTYLDEEWMPCFSLLKNLTDLKVQNFSLYLTYKDCSLPTVKRLTLLTDQFPCVYNIECDGERYCKTLNRQFPNLESLHVVCYHEKWVRKQVELELINNLHHIPSLRECTLKLGVQEQRLCFSDNNDIEDFVEFLEKQTNKPKHTNCCESLNMSKTVPNVPDIRHRFETLIEQSLDRQFGRQIEQISAPYITSCTNRHILKFNFE